MKEGKFYILNWTFSYGSASSNRLLAYANSAVEYGYKVEIIALLRLELKTCQPGKGIVIRGLRPCRLESKFCPKSFLFLLLFGFCLQWLKKKIDYYYMGQLNICLFCMA